MKLNLLAGALGVSLIFSTPFAEALTTTEIVQLAKPAVVLIQRLNSQSGKQQLGTGFFVDPDTIVTNDHVMRGILGVQKSKGSSGNPWVPTPPEN